MRTCLIIFLFCISAGIGVAQENKIIKGATSAAQHVPAMPQQVLDKVRCAMAANATNPAGRTLVQITNLPGAPKIPLKVTPSLTSASGATLLSARAVTGNELTARVFLERWKSLRVPEAFNRDEDALYRGMWLKDLNQLQYILTKGLEVRRTRFPGIFFTNFFADAVQYSAGLYGNFSVIIKVPVTADMTDPLKPDMQIKLRKYLIREYLFMQDLPADKISNVIIFLEIDGIGNWYKVTLENGEMVLEQVPSKILRQEELIMRDIKAERQPLIYDLP